MPDVFAGRFELRQPIDRGGMGEVWTAFDQQSGDLIAVKLMRQSDAAGLLRFMREQTMRIHHPNVLTPLAWAGMDDRVLFSMPLVTGGSVATLVGDYGALPPRYAAELLRQLVAALRAVHAAGVVHRDVKPSNLLLDATGTGRPRLRLTDFGVAVRPDGPRVTTVASVIGTPGYLAPEQMRGADPAPEQDLYALGRVGQELLTGLPPGEQVTAPAGVQPELWQVLDRLSREDPTARPGLAEVDAVLASSELTWVDQQEIEVFEQFTDRPEQDAMATRRHPRPVPGTRTLPPAQPPTPHPQPLPPEPPQAPLQPGSPRLASQPPATTPPPPRGHLLAPPQGQPPVPSQGQPPARPRPPAGAVVLIVLGAVLLALVVWYYVAI